MWITKDDFRVRADNFDLSNGLNILRIICGLFLFPHVMGKFAAGAVSAGTAAFFAKAGFQPPEVWVYIAAVAETAAGVALVLGMHTFCSTRRSSAARHCGLLAASCQRLWLDLEYRWL